MPRPRRQGILGPHEQVSASSQQPIEGSEHPVVFHAEQATVQKGLLHSQIAFRFRELIQTAGDLSREPPAVGVQRLRALAPQHFGPV
jgi:hypothetical protein